MNLWKLPEIVIAPETIFSIGGFPVTNTLLSTWITIVVLVLLFYFGTRRRESACEARGLKQAGAETEKQKQRVGFQGRPHTQRSEAQNLGNGADIYAISRPKSATERGYCGLLDEVVTIWPLLFT